MERILMAALLLSTIGCATDWTKAGVSQYQAQQDLQECECEAEKYAGNIGDSYILAMGGGWRQASLSNKCMQQKGYFLVRD